MRGNHRVWGRQDYTEPPPISPSDRARVAECDVVRVEGMNTWHSVHRNGQLIGYVATRFAGQIFRTVEMEDWMYAIGDWNRSDPPHAHAVLAVIESQAKNS